MTAELREQELGPMRWIVASGRADECFRALGEHMREEIRGAVTGWPLTQRLRRHVAAGPGAARLAAVREATQAAFGQEWAELAALADGAGVAVDDLALLNFRGDLGSVEGRFGCSDLAWRRGRSFIAHNEDQSTDMDGRCALLSLAIDGLPRICAFWCAMFLPSNAFTVTEDGLVCTIDALAVPEPARGAAGRHFVARGLQRQARTMDEAIEYLREHPCASGFAYIIGDPAGRVAVVEAAKDQFGVREAGPAPLDGPLLWHTNHGRQVTCTLTVPGGDSERRGEVLAAARVPDAEPGPGWFLQLLAGAPMPAGVRVDPSEGRTGVTMCTLVADLTAGHIVLLGRGGQPVGIPLIDLVNGSGSADRVTAGAALQQP